MSPLGKAERKAMLARQELYRKEREASEARAAGEVLSEAWWQAFGLARALVGLAERAVSKAREGTNDDPEM